MGAPIGTDSGEAAFVLCFSSAASAQRWWWGAWPSVAATVMASLEDMLGPYTGDRGGGSFPVDDWPEDMSRSCVSRAGGGPTQEWQDLASHLLQSCCCCCSLALGSRKLFSIQGRDTCFILEESRAPAQVSKEFSFQRGDTTAFLWNCHTY